MARLATDPALRARFLADPTSVSAEFGLSPQETGPIEALLPGPIADFAGSLIHKRRREVESLLPITARALGPDRFFRLFRQHASGFVPSGVKKSIDDAVAFTRFLDRELADPDWLRDLARLEASAILAHALSRRWVTVKLRHHPDDLVRDSVETPIVPRPCWVIWLRISSRSRPRRFVLRRPW
jgi:hypothetical protein